MTTYYKVLKDGKSFHGGNTAWPLPTQDGEEWIPGEWLEVSGALRLCSNGLHLTSKPIRWFAEGATIYLVEFDTNGMLQYADKIAVCKARLLRPVTEQEGNALGVWTTGRCSISSGVAILSGNASAILSGNASAILYGNASAELSGIASAILYGNASAELYGNASAELSGNASAKLYGNASAILSDNASATSSRWHSAQKSVITTHSAVHIDRRGDTVKIVVGGVEYAPIAKAEGK